MRCAYLLHNEARVNHFHLRILSSPEWEMSDLAKKVENLEGTLSELASHLSSD